LPVRTSDCDKLSGSDELSDSDALPNIVAASMVTGLFNGYAPCVQF
jgi:hypothetical protein